MFNEYWYGSGYRTGRSVADELAIRNLIDALNLGIFTEEEAVEVENAVRLYGMATVFAINDKLNNGVYFNNSEGGQNTFQKFSLTEKK